MVQIVLLALIPAPVACGCSVEQLVVVAARGVVQQQEEADVKYQSGLSQLVPPVPQACHDRVIYGAALEERIKIHLRTNVPVPDSG